MYEYLAAIQRIRDNPLLFCIAANGLRPCRLKRFSFIIHFDVDAIGYSDPFRKDWVPELL